MPSAIYLDLQAPGDLAKLSEPELYLQQHLDRLVILDEIHRMPRLFPVRKLRDLRARLTAYAGHALESTSSAKRDTQTNPNHAALRWLSRRHIGCGLRTHFCRVAHRQTHSMPKIRLLLLTLIAIALTGCGEM